MQEWQNEFQLSQQREISQLAQQLSGGLDAAVLLSLRYPSGTQSDRSKSKNSSLLLFLFSLLLFLLSSFMLLFVVTCKW